MATKQEIRASVHPHGHTAEFGGPVDVNIGVRSQPALLRDWDTKTKPRFQIEQPDPGSNLTLIKVLFGKYTIEQEKDSPWHRANVYRKTNVRRQVVKQCPVAAMTGTKKMVQQDIDPGGLLVVAIKGRYTKGLPHPLPVGKYQGVCEEGEGWVLFTLQSRTLVVRPTQKPRSNLILPGDADYDATIGRD